MVWFGVVLMIIVLMTLIGLCPQLACYQPLLQKYDIELTQPAIHDDTRKRDRRDIGQLLIQSIIIDEI